MKRLLLSLLLAILPTICLFLPIFSGRKSAVIDFQNGQMIETDHDLMERINSYWLSLEFYGPSPEFFIVFSSIAILCVVNHSFILTKIEQSGWSKFGILLSREAVFFIVYNLLACLIALFLIYYYSYNQYEAYMGGNGFNYIFNFYSVLFLLWLVVLAFIEIFYLIARSICIYMHKQVSVYIIFAFAFFVLHIFAILIIPHLNIYI